MNKRNIATNPCGTLKGITVLTTPPTNNALVYLFISGQEKGELWIFLNLLPIQACFIYIYILQFITH